MDDMLLKAIAEDKAPKISPSSADTKPDPDSTITLCFIDLQGYRYEICGMKRNTRVQEVKEMLELRGGWPPVNQRLIFSGKQIQDDRTLQEVSDVDCSDLIVTQLTPFSTESGITTSFTSSWHSEALEPLHGEIVGMSC